MDAVQRWLTLLTLVAAALAGLLYLARMVWRGFRVVERLSDIVQHELQPNTGSSMKDDVAAIAVAVGKLQHDYRQLSRQTAVNHEQVQDEIDALHSEVRAHHPEGPPYRAPAHKRED